MCGICGIINTNGNRSRTEALIGAMCDVITHRGPDEEGYFIENNVALGMRRLKIIDLYTGSQPIYNEDGSIVVVFNGEIYNFLELKEDLIKRGHKFYTSSDTEVIVHLYEDYREGFLSFLNGMFAIGLWDNKEQKLILARDRMGEKPVYYTRLNDTLIFGSEIKSILCYPGFKKEIEPKAIYHYFTFNNIPAPLTSYKNIYKLFPGEFLTYKNGVVETRRYWEIHFSKTNKLSEDEIKDHLYYNLTKAVKLRLISDVPLGAFLSGGIDSSIMVALMSEISNASVKTFSIGLENERESELPFAREVAQRYGTDHHELIARPDALDLLDQILWHFDEPFGDSSAIPTFLVSQLTKNYVTVAISGDGGDELFGGYGRYRRIMNRSNIQNTPKMLRIPVSKLLGNILPFGFKGKAFLQSLQYDNYKFFTVGTSEELKDYLFSVDFLLKTKNITSYEVADKVLLKGQSLLNQCMFFDMMVYLPDDILTKVDRMSMANSLETRAPFLDHNLVEFAMTISPELKVNRGITKYILKKAFKDFLPENVYTHKKTGFSIPIGDWFKHELKSLVMETLSKGQIEQCGILSHPSIESMVSQHMSGYRSHERLLWLTLMFQLWYDKWFNRTHPKIESALINRGIGKL